MKMVDHPFRMAARRSSKTWSRLRGKKDPLVNVKINHRAVGDWSTTGLIMASANDVLRFGASAGQILGPVTGISSVLLSASALREIVKAETPERRVNAVHTLAWGIQGMGVLGNMFKSQAKWIAPTAKCLGIVGGSIQTFCGVYGLTRGIKQRDKPRMILGGLDISAGVCWVGAACAVPYAMGGFAAFAGGRLAYANRDLFTRDNLKQVAQNLKRPLKWMRGKHTKGINLLKKKKETVIVTAPAERHVVDRALRGPQTVAVNDEDGRPMGVAVRGTVETAAGEERDAVIITPVQDGAPGN